MLAPSTLATPDDLRAWAVRTTTRHVDRAAPPKYLLLDGQNGIGQQGTFFECRGAHTRDWQTLGPTLAKPLAARWPTTRTGGRTHLSAMGVYRLLAGDEAVRTATAEAKAQARAWAAEQARLGRLADLLDEAFSSAHWEADDRARQAWAHTPRPELDGRTPFQAVAASPDAFAVVAPLLDAVRRARETAEAQGWHVELDADALPALPPDVTTGYLRAHATLKGYVHEHGRLAAVVTLVGHAHRQPETSAIAWVPDDPSAAGRLAAASADYVTRAMPPDLFRQQPFTPATAAVWFLWELAGRAVRDARSAATAPTRERP